MSENDTKKVQKCQKNFWNQKIRCSSKRVKFSKFSKSFRYQNRYSIRICWHFRTRFLTFLLMGLVCYILLHFCTVKNLEYFKNLFFFTFMSVLISRISMNFVWVQATYTFVWIKTTSCLIRIRNTDGSHDPSAVDWFCTHTYLAVIRVLNFSNQLILINLFY